MSQSRQVTEGEPNVPTRRGKRIYESNPSLDDRLPVRLIPRQIGKKASVCMYAPGTGEVLAEGAFAFAEEKEVDSEQFMKVYLDGIRQYGQLSKAGAMLFELLYREMSGANAKDRDTVMLNHFIAQMAMPGLSRRTYERGISELLEKEFLYRSFAADVFFVNVRFMFNGDRMVLVKAYRRKGAPRHVEHQRELPLLEAGEGE